MLKSVRKIFFLILVSIGLSNAIDCYICDSLNETDCATLPDSTSLKPETCSVNHIGQTNENWLKKMVTFNIFGTMAEDPPLACQKITIMKDKVEVVYRGCQLNDGKTDICDALMKQAESASGYKISTCITCDEDGCNGSPSLAISKWIILVVVIVLTMFY